MKLIKIFLISLIIITNLFSSEKLEKISLQLNWKYQFEFAGFIAAKEKGFYKDFGLDVDIKEFKFGTNVLEAVKSGNSTFGVYDLSLLELNDEKRPVKLIANYFKRSALVFVTTQNIVTPEDLRNKIIMADSEQIKSSTLSTLLKKFKIEKDDYIFKQHTFTPEEFINGSVDVMSAYLSNEIYHLRELKKPFNIIDPLSYGIYGSGVNVFTKESETLKNPEMVESFIEATNRGWIYALDNKEEIAKVIYNKYSKKKSLDALLFEANQTQKLIMPNMYNIGEVNRTLLERNINDFTSEGLLENKFDINSIVYDFKKQKNSTLTFTKEQKEYVKNKDEITMCIDPDWMPYEKIDNGIHIGMTSDYIPLLSNRIGIPIKLVKTENWSQSVEYAKERKCDIFSLAMATPSRLKYMNFTVPYISFPLVIATKTDQLFISNPDEIVSKKKIGIVKGYAIGEILKKRFPNHKIVDVANVDDGMKKVVRGELFGFLDALPTVAYSLQHKYISELKITGKFEDKLELGIAVRNDEPILFELFQKAVQSINELDKQEILNKYISVKVESSFDYKLFYQVLLVIFVIIVFIFYRHRQVVKYNNSLEKKQKELYETKTKLESSLKSFETLLDSVIESILVSENGICIDINDEAIKMLGYANKEEIIGKPILDFVVPSLHDLVREKLLIDNGPVYELKAIKKDGSEIDILVKGTNTTLNSKKVRVSAIVDITETKQKDRAFFQQSKMAAMGEMIDNIAHQWRQPLSVISTISTSMALKDELNLLDEGEVQRNSNKINDVTQHLSNTIDDFRNFFRGDKEIIKFCIYDSINKNIKLLESTFKNSDIKLVFENMEKISIESYENEFTQALINIFYNAKDALVEKDLNNKLIFINMHVENDFVYIEIKDNAGGIKDDIIENIFDPYFTTKHQSQGTGIGLYMTHQIINDHMHGFISVNNHKFTYENKSYTGAKFTIKLPLKN